MIKILKVMGKLFKSEEKQKMNVDALKAKFKNVEDSKLMNSIVGGIGAAQAACHPGTDKGSDPLQSIF